MFIITVLTLLTIIIFIALYFNKRHTNLPPGPSGLPLIGNTVLFKPKSHELLADLGKIYGNVFRIYFGPKMIVVLNNYDAIKEALLKQGECFAGRPPVFIFDWYQQNEAIIFSSGKCWREQRRFALTTLKEFGFAKSSHEDHIMVEVQNVIEVIASHKERSFKLHYLLDKAVCNVICSLAFGKRYDYESPVLERLLTLMEIVFKNFAMLNPVNVFPFIRHISPAFKQFEKAVHETKDFLNKIIDEHIEIYQQDSPRDFIDVFIQQMKKDEDDNVKDTTFTKRVLTKVIENLFNAATETTSTTLLWGIIYLLRNPEVQKKVEDEIQMITGGSRPVCLSDQANLPYTEATLLEIQRMASIVPLSLFHISDRDTTILNYFIPKNTIVIPNIWATHFDPKYWPDPHVFKPERFIDESGNIRKNPESFIPFSIGKRACLGEPLAKMELFLLFSNLMLRFHFTIEQGQSLPGVNNYTEGVTLRPLPFNLCAKIK